MSYNVGILNLYLVQFGLIASLQMEIFAKPFLNGFDTESFEEYYITRKHYILFVWLFERFLIHRVPFTITNWTILQFCDSTLKIYAQIYI